MEQKNHGSPSFINIAVLLLFAIVIAVVSVVTTYFILNSRSNEQYSPTQSSVVSQPQTNVLPTTIPATTTQTASDETADWKVYRNEKYGFEVKYPQNWFVRTSDPQFTVWSNYSRFDYTPEDIPNDLQSIFLETSETSQSLNDYFNSTYNDPNNPDWKVLEKTTSTIQGKTLLKFTVSDFRNTLKMDNPRGDQVQKALVKINNNVLLFSYRAMRNDVSHVFQSILSTFKFTK